MIVSNLLILLIPIAMGIFLYAKVEDSLMNNANRSNSAMLEQMKLSLDAKLSEVDNLMRQVVLDPQAEYLLKVPAGADSMDEYRFVEFMRDKMNRYRNMTSSFIFDYYVYFRNSDKIVKANLLTDSHTFYTTHYAFADMPYEQWRRELLSGVHQSSYWAARALVRSDDLPGVNEYMPDNVVVYAQTLPIRTPNEALGNLVVLIDVSPIREAFAQLEAASRSEIYIIDHTDKTIMSTSNEPLAADLLARVRENTSPFSYRVGDSDQMVSVTSSDKAGWSYVSITPHDVFMKQVNYIQKWALGLLACCLIAGLLAVYTGAYRSYKPLRNMVNAILRGKQMPSGPAANEYDFIRETIEGSLYEEKNLRAKLGQQIPLIRANYLSRLVQGYMDADVSADSDEMQKFMGVSFVGDRFAVLLVHIEDYKRLTEKESEQQSALVRFMVANVGTDLISPAQHGYSVELDRDRVAFLVNFRPESGETAAEGLRQIAATINSVLTEQFKIDLTLAAGEIHQGAKAVHDSYQEALAALEYRLIRGKKTIIHFSDITDSNQHYYYPLETETQLVNFVRSGDTDNTDKLLDKIYSMNFDSGEMTPELGKCLFFNVTSTFLKIVNSTNTNQAELLGDDFDLIKAVFSYQTAEDMHLKIKALYNKLADSFKVERTGGSPQLLQDIIRFIEASIDNPDLGLALIADHVRLTPPYISTFFRKHQGQTLVDYITRKRIDKAKQLMEDKSLTNAQIASMVGYVNDIVFLRAFKKVEGIPPGKYRETMMQGDSD
ncbi:AraC-type DNA-binding protein [Paenibacillus sp. UNCCL117]|uniref:helix-turn-helix domain-containing protein n=1 Tax=unclassified Paenibacillus TaxID=185978 RepID=UPI00088A5964|nr:MULTISPECIES: helix-turn-helix domain-containing protein [unclassified Paenibacillus]SDD76253.1 AraC-type DNA-binding protein [Paenibacillus sp. cl123]SFW52387.1 AraC-type DNA-binding protein [Paenibacillus sp. UNCCL117]